MSPKEELDRLLDELDRTHSPEYLSSREFRENLEFPDFVTAECGDVRHYYQHARNLLAVLSGLILEGNPSFRKRVDQEHFNRLLRQAIADIHACESPSRGASNYQRLLKTLNDRLAQAEQRFTHSFPAWTCGIERDSTWTIGPVAFMTWEQWISLVDFPEQLKQAYVGNPNENRRWKEVLRQAIASNDDARADGLAGTLSRSARSCPSVLRCEVEGFEIHFSRKLAEIACKSALDSVSLMIGQRRAFFQQALQFERLPPAGVDMLVETKDGLMLPGTRLTDRIPSLDRAGVSEFLSQNLNVIRAMGHAIEGLLSPSHSNRELSSRWATALDWYAEGQREISDAVAVAKLGTSLDVLAGGGKCRGILELLCHLLGVPQGQKVTLGHRPTTLKAIVAQIYDRGRSQILHGTRHDRMEAFELERYAASWFGRIALIEAVLRLESYSGPCSKDAFRRMTK